MTRLLVSVRDAAEAGAALAGGADLIDVKEPLRGALGAADASMIAAVVREVASRVPVSAALGELVDWSNPVGNALRRDPGAGMDTVVRCAERHAARSLQIADVCGLSYAKLGLAGCASLGDWPDRWAHVVESFPVAVVPVAVVYADWQTAAAPRPDEILAVGVRLSCQALLIDTFDKSRGGLLEHWPVKSLAAFLSDVRAAGLLVVLAGSLTRDTIPAVLALAPDYIALRGAVCRGDRTGTIDTHLVRSFREAVEAAAIEPAHDGQTSALDSPASTRPHSSELITRPLRSLG